MREKDRHSEGTYPLPDYGMFEMNNVSIADAYPVSHPIAKKMLYKP